MYTKIVYFIEYIFYNVQLNYFRQKLFVLAKLRGLQYPAFVRLILQVNIIQFKLKWERHANII